MRTLEERYVFVEVDDNGRPSDFPTWTHPAHPEIDPINYDLRLHSQAPSSSHPFEALSYVWGLDNMTGAVVVRTPEGPKMLRVTANLQEALVHLRHNNSTRSLWIDAICLNQADASEKNQQIPRMRDIYRFADRVAVWMGPERESTRRAISVVNSIANRVEVSDDGSMVLRSPDAPGPALEIPLWPGSFTQLDSQISQNFWKMEDVFFVNLFTQSDFQACETLLGVPWTYRLWIVQEVRLARKRPSAIMQWGRQTAEVCNVHRAAM